MGLLRTYLALCVVAGHSTAVFPWASHDADHAVQIFFSISGFYMALILSGRYRSLKEFYVSRWLRIFPPYYAVLAGVVIWSVIVGVLVNNWLALSAYASDSFQRNGLVGMTFAGLTNFTIIGQDWVMFLTDGGTFGFTSNFHESISPLWQYLVIPQGWSLGVEESCYLLAPFLIKLRSRTLAVILALSVGARLSAYHIGFRHDPWTYRFFPFELALFICGILAYRLYLHIGNWIPQLSGAKFYPLACAVLIIGLWLNAVVTEMAAQWIAREYVFLMAVPVWSIMVAILFACFRQNAVDRFVGDLCFPIYLTHLIVIESIGPALGWLQLSQENLGKVSALITVAISVAFCLAIRPYERWRHAFVSTGKNRNEDRMISGRHTSSAAHQAA